MSPVLTTLLTVLGALVIVAGGFGLLLARWWRRVGPEQALVVNKTGRLLVSFNGALVLPVFHAAEVMDLTAKRVDVERTGPNAVHCRDGARVDVKLAVFVKVPRDVAAISRIAEQVGCEAASSAEKVAALFSGKFAEAVDVVASQLTFADLHTRRPFKNQLIEVIGLDLDGFELTEVVIDRVARVERPLPAS